jgi:hypothetical protein
MFLDSFAISMAVFKEVRPVEIDAISIFNPEN